MPPLDDAEPSGDRTTLELSLLTTMRRIRAFEHAVSNLVDLGLIRGTTHLSIGQEATIAGACAPLERRDYMFGNHRSHGHPIAKGADLVGLMAEVLGRAGGVCRGLGGSMHLTDVSVGAMGEVAIVGSGLPLAVGAGLSCQLEGNGRVTLCFFGDGATTTGAFFESLNLAALWSLPVVFVCENNLYSVTAPLAAVSATTDLGRKADAASVPACSVDGQDALAVYDAVAAAVAHGRGGGPSFVEARTYRTAEHGRMKLSHLYRSEAEVSAWEARDPIALAEARLSAAGVDPHVLQEVQKRCTAEVASAVTAATAQPVIDADLSDFIFSPPGVGR